MSINSFFWILGVLLGAYLVVLLVYRIRDRYSITLPSVDMQSHKALLSWAIRDGGIKKRVAVTIILLIVLGAASFLPIPGVNLEAIKNIMGTGTSLPAV